MLQLQVSYAFTSSLPDSVSPAPTSINAETLFDRKIDLVTVGIDSFIGSKHRELPKDNALTIVNYFFP
jgi:hypothetical protein